MRDEILAECQGDPAKAAGLLAARLAGENPADPLRAGYTPENAASAAHDLFPEVPVETIRAWADAYAQGVVYEPEPGEPAAQRRPDGLYPDGLYIEDPFEERPCLVCGATETGGDPCDCLAPTRIVTVEVEVKARSRDDLPSPDDLRGAVEQGLHDDYFSRVDGDPWWISSLGFPGNRETFTDQN